MSPEDRDPENAPKEGEGGSSNGRDAPRGYRQADDVDEQKRGDASAAENGGSADGGNGRAADGRSGDATDGQTTSDDDAGGGEDHSANDASADGEKADAVENGVDAADANLREAEANRIGDVVEERGATEKREPGFALVGIGASAGGLEALKNFFGKMPPDSGMGFVVVQHLDPNHDSMMSSLIGRYTKMQVNEAKDAVPLQPNQVYVIPPGKFLRVVDGGLFLEAPVQKRGMRMPIDHFFRSMAEARGPKAIAIVLSGTGSDGSQGIREIKAAGGLTIAQKPDTAEYDGMPRSAIGTGMIDLSLTIENMPTAISRFAEHPYVDADQTGAGLDEAAPDQFDQIIRLLRAHTNYDFRSYKVGTLNRRIHRRMSLYRHERLADYVAHLRKDHQEIQSLFKDLLISVTRFFRDSDSWTVLQDKVIPEIVGRKKAGESIRVWVPGCATGEEAYSMAILLAEELEKQRRPMDAQIFATDLDEDAIAYAREGLYPESIAQDVSPPRLRQFFVEERGQLRVTKRLRQMTVFAAQNLIGDPPFSNIDVISCRNLMIYLEGDVQGRVIELMHFALAQNGYLFLGSSETLGKQSELFSAVSSSHRVFRRVDRPSRMGEPRFPIQGRSDGDRRTKRTRSRSTAEPQPAPWTSGLRQAIMKVQVPPSVVVDRRNEVVFVHGQVRPYLSLPEGELNADLLHMVDPGSRPKLRTAMQRAVHGGERSIALLPKMKRNGTTVDVRVEVSPMAMGDGAEPLYLVAFNDMVPAGPEGEDSASPESDSASGNGRVQQLEYELSATREDLQSTIEELESSNEELKASNEEVMSMNEELQSTNEELETSREELQSLNEELSTVNNQLEDKVSELQATNDDLSNLLTSTGVATIFLDTNLRIRRYTPAMSKMMHLIDSDIGRPLSDLAPGFEDRRLIEDARDVLADLTPAESEIRNGGNRAYIRRILPYRTGDNRIDGVVVTFTDVTRLRETADMLASRERQAAAIAELGRLATSLEQSSDPLMERCVGKIAELLDVKLVKLLELVPGHAKMLLRHGVGWQPGLVGQAEVAAGASSQAGFTLQAGSPVIVDDLRRERRFSGPPLLTDHGVVSGLSVTIGPPERAWGVLGVHTTEHRKFTTDDVHFVTAVANVLWDTIERQRAETAQAAIADRLHIAINVGRMATWEWRVKEDVATWSDGHFSMLGYEPGEVQPGLETWLDRVHPEDVEVVREAVQSALSGEGVYQCEYRVIPRPGEETWLEARGQTTFDDAGHPVSMYGVLIDIQERKETEATQTELLRELDHRVKNILANVVALAKQTRRNASSMDGFVGDFTGRVNAIAQAHALLSKGRWSGVVMGELLALELAPYADSHGRNLEVSGPTLTLRPEDAQIMAIGLHELTTNAAKYGALGNEDGELQVRWWLEETGGERRVVLIWRESGGQEVKDPARQGFGTTVLTQYVPGQLDGTLELKFEPDGLVCELRFPASRVRLLDGQNSARAAPEPARGETEAPETTSLAGLNVLVVEDSPLTAEDVKETCLDAGAERVFVARTLAEAEQFADEAEFSVAVLDRNIGGTLSDPFANRLRANGTPFIFLTGYGDGKLPPELSSIAFVTKPFEEAALVREIARTAGNGGG